MRTFRHLSQAQISDIITSHRSGEQATAIAQRLAIHHSTVIYHVRKHADGSVYAIIPPKPKVCLHPSAKCLVCQQPWDEIRRQERAEIDSLRKKLRDAHDTLRTAGYLVAE